MALRKSSLLWASLLGVLVSGSLFLVAVGYLGLVVYSGLVSGTPLVRTLLSIAVPLLVGVGLLVVILVLSGVGLVWALVRHASLPRSDRIATVAERVEREYPPLRMLGISDLLAPPEPTPAERSERALADLRRQYVDGEISELEFERRVDQLVSTESVYEVRAARERTRDLDDR